MVEGNWVHDDVSRGVQLFPDAQRSTVRRNVIDGNGVGVIISNSVLRQNVESHWEGGTRGRGNVVRDNCAWQAPGLRDDAANGGVSTAAGGFTASGNVVADPAYADRAADDLRVGEDSPCRRLLGAAADAAPGPQPP